MYCSHLTLTNFRNYPHLELDLPEHLVVIQGDNAQGKSNLLEAIYLLATTRSHRAVNEGDLINWYASDDVIPVARLLAVVQRTRGRIEVEIAIRGQQRAPTISPEDSEPAFLEVMAGEVQKRIRVNGNTTRATDLIGEINVVMFSPADIDLIAGSPALRRRYLDITLSQTDRRYLQSLQRYKKVLFQRNHLLRLLREHRAEPDQLVFWDQELVSSGSYLITERQHLLAALSDLANTIHLPLTSGRESLDIAYLPGWLHGGLSGEYQLQAVAQALSADLLQAQERDIILGTTSVGPHRDDLRFTVNGIDMNIYGSRGQQRTIALSLKLAEVAFLRSRANDYPILLLDDILSELDMERRQQLLQSIAAHQQVLITSTDLDRFTSEFLAQAVQFRIKGGAVSPITNP